MDIFCIRGGTPLHGRIALHGAKNAALPLLAATLATGARCELLDCPDISDVTAACAILRHLGCAVEQHGAAVVLHENHCDGELLFRTTQELLADAPRRASMRKALQELAVVDSASRICDIILNLAKTHKS